MNLLLLVGQWEKWLASWHVCCVGYIRKSYHAPLQSRSVSLSKSSAATFIKLLITKFTVHKFLSLLWLAYSCYTFTGPWLVHLPLWRFSHKYCRWLPVVNRVNLIFLYWMYTALLKYGSCSAQYAVVWSGFWSYAYMLHFENGQNSNWILFCSDKCTLKN